VLVEAGATILLAYRNSSGRFYFPKYAAIVLIALVPLLSRLAALVRVDRAVGMLVGAFSAPSHAY
jgi:hypothetical protein